jgi:hypothetical protein
MQSFEERIESLDLSLFEAILSETTDEDRRSLLQLQRLIRRSGPYVYLEIGSHLGGTIQPHYIDPLCKMIISIDKRPLSIPDERGINFEYPYNSTNRMLQGLQAVFPLIDRNKIKTFDCDVSEINNDDIIDRPQIIFIDAEHTNHAVYSDFMFCLDVCDTNAIIAFHDATFIFRGILRIKKFLVQNSFKFKGIMLGGSVYAILFNEAIEASANGLQSFMQDEAEFFNRAKADLFEMRLQNRHKMIYKFYNWLFSCRNKNKRK